MQTNKGDERGRGKGRGERKRERERERERGGGRGRGREGEGDLVGEGEGERESATYNWEHLLCPHTSKAAQLSPWLPKGGVGKDLYIQPSSQHRLRLLNRDSQPPLQ